MDDATFFSIILICMSLNAVIPLIWVYHRYKKDPDYTKQEIGKVIGVFYYIGLMIIGVSIPLCAYSLILIKLDIVGFLLLCAGIIIVYNYRSQSQMTSPRYKMKLISYSAFMGAFALFAYSKLISMMIEPMTNMDRLIQSSIMLIIILIVMKSPRYIFAGNDELTDALHAPDDSSYGHN